ncbi:hypothetical protein [Polaribacter sp.]
MKNIKILSEILTITLINLMAISTIHIDTKNKDFLTSFPYLASPW